MPSDPDVRRHRGARRPRPGPVTTAVLCGVLTAGCASDDGGGREAASPTSTAPTPGGSSATAEVTTSSEKYPEWQPIAGMETPRDDFGAAVIGTDIWTMGGMSGARGTRLTSIEVLDTETGEWRTPDLEMPRGLASFETVAMGRRIYAFGGFDADSTASTSSQVLDTDSGRWRRLPALPHARYAHTVTLHDGLVYVIGGRDGDGPVAEVDVFDPRRERWTTLEKPMPSARDSHKAVSTPRGLVVAGGFRDYEGSDLVHLLDPRTGTWTGLPDLPEPMSRAGLAYVDDRLFIALHSSSYVMDPARAEEWEPANALTLSRHGMGFVTVKGAIYSIAGCALDPLRDVRTVDRLELS